MRKKNKGEILPKYLEVKMRQKDSDKFVYSDELTLLSYCPPKKKKKIVLMLSIMYEKRDEPNENQKLLDIIHIYKHTKTGR